MKKWIIIISVVSGLMLFVFVVYRWVQNLELEGKITILIVAEEDEDLLIDSVLVEQLILNIVKPPASDTVAVSSPPDTVQLPIDSVPQSDTSTQTIAQTSEIVADTSSPFLILDSNFEAAVIEGNFEVDSQTTSSVVDSDTTTTLSPAREDTLFVTDFHDLNIIEKGLEAHPFIAQAQITKDFNNNIRVKVYQRRPLARLWTSSHKKTYLVDRQITSVTVLSSSPRTLIMMGAGIDSLSKASFWESKLGWEWYQFLEGIHEDNFLNLMIGQIEVDEHLRLKLYPQLGRQVFHFGYLEDQTTKIEKLKLFYTHIIPKRGWKKYRQVFLYHKDRIICR